MWRSFKKWASLEQSVCLPKGTPHDVEPVAALPRVGNQRQHVRVRRWAGGWGGGQGPEPCPPPTRLCKHALLVRASVSYFLQHVHKLTPSSQMAQFMCGMAENGFETVLSSGKLETHPKILMLALALLRTRRCGSGSPFVR